MSYTNIQEQPAEIAGAQRPPMPVSQPVVTQIIQRIKKDKILFGLIVVGILTVFVGAVCSNDDAPKSAPAQSLAAPNATALPAQTAAVPLQTAQPGAPALDPKLAAEFIKWWITKSMDYVPQSAPANHKEATGWMTQRAAEAFLGCFWNSGIVNEIMTGHVQAAFQPATVQAVAINPDGSVVVAMTGTLMIQQANMAPMTQQINCDFLVRKEAGNLRICDLYNHSPAPTPASAASPY